VNGCHMLHFTISDLPRSCCRVAACSTSSAAMGAHHTNLNNRYRKNEARGMITAGFPYIRAER
jgi:hypothetical protein